MPEIKHDFSAGKMNKDLDERLVPNGEYRDAMNIQVRTTESQDGAGNAGTIQNIKGNKRISENVDYETGILAQTVNETKVIGSIANEKNNTAYFFIASPSIEQEEIELSNSSVLGDAFVRKQFVDYIVEINSGQGNSLPQMSPIVVDRWAFIDSATNILGDVYTADGLNLPIVFPTDWTTFTIKADAKDIRIGMEITLFDSSGNSMLGVPAEIQNIEVSSSPDYMDITLYDPQQSIDINDCESFLFKHPNRVLRFDNTKKITGINIIDDLLFWTDNNGEPKKINIERCRAGTASSPVQDSDYSAHSQLKMSLPTDEDILLDFTNIDGYGNEDGTTNLETSLSPLINNDLKEEHITVIRKAPLMAPTLEMKTTDREGGNTDIFSFRFNFGNYDFGNGEIAVITPDTTITIPTNADIIADSDGDATTTSWTVDVNMFDGIDYRVNDIIRFTEEIDGVENAWVTAVIDDINITEDADIDPNNTIAGDQGGYTVLTITILTVSENLSAAILDSNDDPIIPGAGFWTITLQQRRPLFELKMGRFGLRYKYEDGEYSSFGPWSELAFLPGEFDYNHKKGFNLGMVNNMRSLKIKDFIPHQRVRPLDMVAVDILWKTTTSPNVYIVKTITRGRDPEWDLFVTQPGLNESMVFGELTLTSEMIHKTLAGKQLLRAWDNVPKKALAQEVAANRIVYGNYEQGYEIKNTPGLLQTLNSYSEPTLTSPTKSIKSIRDYKFGMVFGDKYGRETPVIAPGYLTGDDFETYTLLSGDTGVEKLFSSTRNTFTMLQKWDSIDASGIPDDWIEYVKYYVKETTNEYYNLVMDRWYYAEDGNIWISFSSADRNKLDEETYIILKNEHGTEVPVEEKARYKIIAIENEAPDFIKRDPRNMGMVKLGTEDESFYEYDYMFTESNPDATTAVGTVPISLMEGTEMFVHEDNWEDFLGGYTDKQGDLEIRIKAYVNESKWFESDVWRLVTYFNMTEIDGSDDTGVIRWDKPFLGEADMFTKASSFGIGTPLSSIQYYMEFREMVVANKSEFDGKFFVKIEKDEILSAKILKLIGENINWVPETGESIAYIENQEWNPSALWSTNAADMPRRAYRWFNHSSNTKSFDSDGDGVGDTTVQIGVPASTAGGSGNTGMQNIAAVTAANQMWWFSGSCCVATSESDDDFGVAIHGNLGNAGSTGEFGGCKSVDAEYYALGCWDGDGIDSPNSAATAGYAGGGSVNSAAYNTFNRARETYSFWRWWLNTANDSNETGHGARLFIDGMRVREMKMEDGGGSGLPSGASFVTDSFFATDPPSATNPETYPSMYYKPTGIDGGRMASSPTADEVFQPTTSGTLGRIFISQAGMAGSLASGFDWNTTSEFLAALQTYGKKFRFDSDPNGTIYQIVSATPQKFRMFNHSLIPEQMSGEIEGQNAILYTYWKDNGPTDWYNYSGDGNPFYNTAQPGYSCYNATMSWNSGSTTFNGMGVGCRGQVSWTNKDPQRYFYDNDPMQDTIMNGAWSTNYGSWSNSGLSGTNPFRAVWAGGFQNTPEQLLGQIGDGNVPWDYEGSGSWGNNGVCNHCGSWPGTITTNYTSCHRRGIRIEFRKFDRETGQLAVDTSQTGTNAYNGQPNGMGSLGIEIDEWDPRGAICHDGREAMRISILSATQSGGEVYIPTSMAACWETEPKEDVGLDIYYEISNAIPITLSSENTANFAPYGSKIKVKQYVNGYIDDPNISNTDHFVSHIGYNKTHSIVGVSVTNTSSGNVEEPNSYTVNSGIQTETGSEPSFLIFEHPDGTKTMSRVIAHMESTTNTFSNIEENVFIESATETGFYKLDSDVYKFPIELGWFNCYTWGNGVESDRIRDDYNAPQIDNGVKVSTTLLDYGKERRNSGMIYSGIYNSTSGVNDLNEFNMSEKITKDINPSYGSIQRLKTRDTDVVILTEDKVLKSVTNKDALYNADGNPQLIASNRVLGTAVPFSGDYGISNNPESLAWDQYRLYFTDMQRGSVLRLSRDGLTPISNLGMKTWFRDNLKNADKLIGTFDVVNGEYNLTLKHSNYNSSYNTTVSFNEASRGWVSFKSFVPEEGVSVGGRYFTAISNLSDTDYPKVGIYQHHIDITKNDSNALNFGEVINRNTFYASDTDIQTEETAMYQAYQQDSNVSVLFNDNPSKVKSFRAINYEGSQARIEQFIETPGGQTTADGGGFGLITDGEYYNLQPVDGWWVSNIKTDLSEIGEVPEFKEKEGMWFNRILGGNIDIANRDLSEFSVQGIGILGGIVDPLDVENVYISITSDMVDNTSNDSSQDYNGNTDGSATNYYPPGQTPPSS